MKKLLPWLVGAITGLLAFGLFFLPGSANANQTPGPSFTTCDNLKSWTVNSPDEDDRRPTPTVDGLEFKIDQLIHHATSVALEDLKPGAFVATPQPDQDSFFSVEVRDKTTGGYGTLRFNTSTQEWDLTTNLDSFHRAKPVDFVGIDTKYGKLTSATRVVSFGVGYTKNPPGSVTTVVSEVIFQNDHYSLTCKPAPSSSAPSSGPATKPTKTSSSPSASHTSSPAAGGNAGNGSNTSSGALAITGPSTVKMVVVGGLILTVGAGALVVASRRRKNKFVA